MRRLLCDPERAPDLRPAAAGRARFLHEVVDEVVGRAANLLGQLDRRHQSIERSFVATLCFDRAEQPRQCRLRFDVVKARLTVPRRQSSLEDLSLERLAPYLRDAQATGSHDHLLIAAGELERVDLAALLETPAEGVDHLLATVADPVLAQPLPGDVGIE